MTVKELCDYLKEFDDNTEVMTKKTEVFGTIGYVYSVRMASYKTLGTVMPCILLSDENFDGVSLLMNKMKNEEEAE